MSYKDYSSMQLDALKEVGNIGVGNSATALSQLLNKKVDITVPNVNIVPFDEFYKNGLAEKIVIGVLVRVLGDCPGNILFVFEEESALNIVRNLMGDHITEMNDMAMSALCEVGNIISSSYMNSISKFTNLAMMSSVPAINCDMLGAMLTTVFMESGQYDEYVLDIETSFIQEGNNKTTGNFYFIPIPGALEKILGSLGI
ncbi:chemotaxis protein CheC [Hathewaya proteolytica DSM 3090]|uniref:Chemotaxis protein CheC n=1 Tax=Hathewaya proteolytica DSM 3090 TaxID=1121331 RepID=A0A1M6LCD2_9CLOT|nr:chemotaxis protein CheC [Hathewaya proteolytica]SHJ68857.1 chemotaxis protein CheC [Hathewaya proteolytica DSM 3090]